MLEDGCTEDTSGVSLTESVAAGLSLSEGLFPQVEGEVVISQVGGDEAGKVGGFRSSRRRARSPGRQREDPGEPFFVTRFAGPQFPETRGKRQLRTRLSLFVPSTLYSLAADDHHPLVGATLTRLGRFAGLVPSDVADAVAVIHSDPGPLADALVARGDHANWPATSGSSTPPSNPTAPCSSTGASPPRLPVPLTSPPS